MSTASISQEILFGTLKGVDKLIKEGANVNEKDIYGLTPLIEATLKEDLSIAELLLDNGAKIDQEDIGGQTALQWAVNRHLPKFCDLYLRHKADPNHYSADGQPILVNPSLRNQKEMLALLTSYGAKPDFAVDFINTKLIGHRFELTGKARILNTKRRFVELKYEGFYLEFTVEIIYRTLKNYLNNPSSLSFNSYKTVLTKILSTLKSASEIIPYKYLKKGPEQYHHNIMKVLNNDLVVIPVSYEGHAITFIKYGNLWAKCDRGVKHIVDTVVIYEVGNPYALNADFLKDLMYNNKDDHYISQEIKKILNLKPLISLPARYQLSGNCSWANVEAAVPAMMFMLMYQRNGQSLGEMAALKKSIMHFYDVWVEWDKDRVLNEYIQAFYQGDKRNQAAKASTLAAVLFQRCRASHKKELERAKKILSILAIPDYSYILKSYIKVYYTKMAGKMGEDFIHLLKACKFNLSALNFLKPRT